MPPRRAWHTAQEAEPHSGQRGPQAPSPGRTTPLPTPSHDHTVRDVPELPRVPTAALAWSGSPRAWAQLPLNPEGPITLATATPTNAPPPPRSTRHPGAGPRKDTIGWRRDGGGPRLSRSSPLQSPLEKQAEALHLSPPVSPFHRWAARGPAGPDFPSPWLCLKPWRLWSLRQIPGPLGGSQISLCWEWQRRGTPSSTRRRSRGARTRRGSVL